MWGPILLNGSHAEGGLNASMLVVMGIGGGRLMHRHVALKRERGKKRQKKGGPFSCLLMFFKRGVISSVSNELKHDTSMRSNSQSTLHLKSQAKKSRKYRFSSTNNCCVQAVGTITICYPTVRTSGTQNTTMHQKDTDLQGFNY